MEKTLIINTTKFITMKENISDLTLYIGYNGLLMFKNYDIPDNADKIEININKTEKDMTFVIEMTSLDGKYNISRECKCEPFNIYQIDHIKCPEDESIELYFTDGLDDYSDKERYFPFQLEEAMRLFE